eukprot:m.441332 g.441332  ORF g.441332 m.441332 type:complete len:306 (+) comp18649_c0_seq1:59-976(+)
MSQRLTQSEALSKVDLGQSVSERVEVRGKIRALEEKITVEDNDVNMLRQINAVFEGVKNTREAAMDSVVLRKFSEKAAKRVLANRKGSVPWKSVQDFKDHLLQLVHMGKWKAVGRKATKRMRVAPTPRFMLGPLKRNTEKKARAVVKRREKWDSSQATVSANKLDDKHEKAQDFSDERVLEMYNVLTKIEQAEDDDSDRKGVCLFELCLNPKSYSQSIENLFHLACLVKNQTAEIENHPETGLPRVYVAETQKKEGDDQYEEGEDDKPVQQGVFNLTNREWKEAITLFGIKKSLLPHRKSYVEAE